MIFGGGYDNKSEDLEPPTRPNVYGRAVYALDAASGNPLWSAVSALSSSGAGYVKQVSGMNFSVAADVLTVDRTLDGRADRLYFADVAGNIWRADIDDAAVANWKVWKIASLAGSGLDERKFLFSPDVVLGADNDTFDAVVIGSGDREHPLASNDANSIVNRVYMVKDTNRGTTGTDLDIQESELFDATNDSNVPADKKGWFITLANGEKVVNGPLVLAGRMFFGTNQPDTSNTSCDANLGIARRYDINFLNAAATGYTDASGNFLRFEEAAGGGFLPSPVAGIVQVNGVPYTFVTDNPLSPGGVISPVINVPAKRQRTYWHEKLE